MELINKYNKGIRYLLCVIDIISKYAWVVPLKDKKGVTIVNIFQKRKPNKIQVDQGSEFYDSSFQKQLDDNDIKLYSTYNQGKSVLAERFIRTLKKKIYKHDSCVKKCLF